MLSKLKSKVIFLVSIFSASSIQAHPNHGLNQFHSHASFELIILLVCMLVAFLIFKK